MSAARAVAAVAWVAAVGAPLAIGAAWLVRTDPQQAGPLEAAAVFAALLVQTFALHLGLAVAGLALIAIVIRRRRLAGVLGLGAALGLGPAALTWAPGGPAPGTGAGPEQRLVVLSANLLYARADPERLLAWIDEVDPDIIVLQEHDAPWPRIVHERLRGAYPHIWQEPRRGAFGQAIVSRLPLLDVRGAPDVGEWDVPCARATVQHAGGRVDVYCVHVLPPIGYHNIVEQRRQIAWLAEDAGARLASGAVEGVILAGDFNAPFSTNHMRELRAAGLREAHATVGRGRGATWGPRRGVLSLAPGVRLDHAIWGGELAPVWSRVGPDIESDHRPVAAEFVWSR